MKKPVFVTFNDISFAFNKREVFVKCSVNLFYRALYG